MSSVAALFHGSVRSGALWFRRGCYNRAFLLSFPERLKEKTNVPLLDPEKLAAPLLGPFGM